MRQITQNQWKMQWNGHFIAVENWRDALGRTGVRVLVDGSLIEECKSEWLYTVGFLESRVELDGEFENESGAHRIKVKFGLNRELICHIFVDDELVGGDTEKKIALTETEAALLPLAAQKKRLKHQLLWFFLVLPVIFFLMFRLLDSYFPDERNFSVFIYPLALCIVKTLIALSRLSQLPHEDDTKNPTSV